MIHDGNISSLRRIAKQQKEMKADLYKKENQDVPNKTDIYTFSAKENISAWMCCRLADASCQLPESGGPTNTREAAEATVLDPIDDKVR